MERHLKKMPLVALRLPPSGEACIWLVCYCSRCVAGHRHTELEIHIFNSSSLDPSERFEIIAL